MAANSETRNFFGKVYELAAVEYSSSAQKRVAMDYRRKGYSVILADARSGRIGGDTEYYVYIRKTSRKSASRAIARVRKSEKEEKRRYRESLRSQRRAEKNTYIRSYDNRGDAEYFVRIENGLWHKNYYVRKEGNRFVVRRRK